LSVCGNRLERFDDEDSFFADFEFGCAECRRVQKVIHVEGETVAGGFFPDAVFFRVVEFEDLVSGCSSQIDEGDSPLRDHHSPQIKNPKSTTVTHQSAFDRRSWIVDRRAKPPQGAKAFTIHCHLYNKPQRTQRAQNNRRRRIPFAISALSAVKISSIFDPFSILSPRHLARIPLS